MQTQGDNATLIAMGLLGVAAVVMGVVGLIRGKAPTGQGWVARSEKPGWFWASISLNLALGVLLIGMTAWKLLG